MKNLRIPYFGLQTIILMLILSLFFACKKNGTTTESPDNGSENPDQLTCPGVNVNLKINGVTYSGSSIHVMVDTLYVNNDTCRVTTFKCFANGGTLTINYKNWNWQLPPAIGLIEKTYCNIVSDSNVVCTNNNCDNLDITYQHDSELFLPQQFNNCYSSIITSDATQKRFTADVEFNLEGSSTGFKVAIAGTLENICIK